MKVLSKFLMRAAVVASVSAMLGSTAAFAAKNQGALVIAGANTTVIASQVTKATTTTNTAQLGGPFTNQNAVIVSGTSASASQTINAGSANVIVINQQ